MAEENTTELALKLHQEAMKENAENRKDIEAVKRNFEDFYREEIKFQADMKNRMDVVSKGQDHLKERFEEGTAKTLARLEKSFSDFRVEWGAKKKEDEVRDEKINVADVKAEKANGKYDLIIRGSVILIFVLILLAYIKGNYQLP